LLFALALSGWADEPTYPVAFRIALDAPAEVVYLAGSFNQWQPRLTPMTPDADKRVWTLMLNLPAGAHQYKFVVNGTDWRSDPTAPAIDDGNGNLNSVVWVEPDGYNRPARLGDGQITRSAIRHAPSDLRDRNPIGGQLYLRLRVRKDDVAQATLLYRQNGRTRRLAMTPFVSDALYTYFRAQLPEADMEYWFELRDGRTRLRLPAGNATYRHRRGENRFEVPDWVQDAVFYQIVPDRFYNADPTNDPDPSQPIDFTGRIEGDGFYGGDLQGILKQLDYLRMLGVDALYLTPVFASVTHHNYDTDDYERVDPDLGADADLRQLAQTLHQHDMRLILDGVFNHVGVYFFAFQDLLRHQEQSPFRDWFIVERFPVAVEWNPSYWAWWNIPYMPKLNHANPVVRCYLLGVVERWTRELRLDGWRLDVPNEVPNMFWREFRPVVRRANPNAVIIGEIWDDAGLLAAGRHVRQRDELCVARGGAGLCGAQEPHPVAVRPAHGAAAGDVPAPEPLRDVQHAQQPRHAAFSARVRRRPESRATGLAVAVHGDWRARDLLRRRNRHGRRRHPRQPSPDAIRARPRRASAVRVYARADCPAQGVGRVATGRVDDRAGGRCAQAVRLRASHPRRRRAGACQCQRPAPARDRVCVERRSPVGARRQHPHHPPDDLHGSSGAHHRRPTAPVGNRAGSQQ
jgi:hypothetical protein